MSPHDPAVRRWRHAAATVQTIAMLVVAAGLIGFSIWWGRRQTPSAVLERTDDQFPVDYVCEACQHKFQMTYQQAWTLIREGKTESPPGQYRRFPCPRCGQVKAVSHEAVAR
ncbi:MAG: hypothetical protein N2652_02545 [Kiritimatiellae bacterium]|nr:hypothetical protein [Kiritimatiellia bacterium]